MSKQDVFERRVSVCAERRGRRRSGPSVGGRGRRSRERARTRASTRRTPLGVERVPAGGQARGARARSHEGRCESDRRRRARRHARRVRERRRRRREPAGSRTGTHRAGDRDSGDGGSGGHAGVLKRRVGARRRWVALSRRSRRREVFSDRREVCFCKKTQCPADRQVRQVTANQKPGSVKDLKSKISKKMYR